MTQSTISRPGTEAFPVAHSSTSAPIPMVSGIEGATSMQTGSGSAGAWFSPPKTAWQDLSADCFRSGSSSAPERVVYR
jgi:hypothetical protein